MPPNPICHLCGNVIEGEYDLWTTLGANPPATIRDVPVHKPLCVEFRWFGGYDKDTHAGVQEGN